MPYERKNFVATYYRDPDNPESPITKRVKWEDSLAIDSGLESIKVVALLDENGEELNTPPAENELGDEYIVGDNPTGAWIGHSGQKATYVGSGSGWTFGTPDAPTQTHFDGHPAFGVSFGQVPEKQLIIRKIKTNSAQQSTFGWSKKKTIDVALPSKLNQAAAGMVTLFVYEEGDGSSYDAELAAADAIDPMDIPLT